MQLDQVTAELRPRSDWEAVDLGFAMVRRDFWRCFTVWWLAMLLPTVVSGVLLWDEPFIFLVIFWWLKPAGARMVLFEISRRLFGEKPPWRAVWRELPKAWTRRFFYRFVWARFSPWLPVTLAVEDLEGLRGNSYRKRCEQVVRRGGSVAMSIYFAAECIGVWLGLAILGLVLMLIPEGLDQSWQLALDSWDMVSAFEVPDLIMRTVVICTMMAISLTDLFLTGSGFGIYINNRTWLEGWDVELAFKRLAQRLSKSAALLLCLLVFCGPQCARSEEVKSPAEVIKQVKDHPDFKVHTIKERVSNRKSSSGSAPGWLLGLGQAVMYIFAACAVMLLLGVIGWAVWKNRHVFLLRRGKGNLEVAPQSARVVMGMEVSLGSLPPDVPTAAWLLWQQGKHQEALALLYRGAISRVIETARVEIQESDTEGDCLRRVESAGQVAHAAYFRGITAAWSGIAYGGMKPDDGQVQALCQQWPFGERRQK